MHRLGRPLALLVGLSTLLVSPGCNTGGGGGSGEIAYEDLDEAQLDALCDYLVRCGFASSAQICLDAWSRLISSSPDLDAAIENGTVIYDSTAAAACGQSVRNAGCGDFLSEGFASAEACDQVFQGTIEEGGTCWIDEQCVSEECELSDCAMACCQGSCVASAPEAAIGEDCLSGQSCVSGAHCDFDMGTCVADLSEGASCAGDNECASSLDCIASTCQAPPGEGEACLDFQCASPYACDVDTGTCQPLRHENEPCNPTASICSLGLVCNPDSNTCTLPGGVGSACDYDLLGFNCGEGAYCDYDFMLDEGTCQPLVADGEPCEGDTECLSFHCGIEGTCGPEPVCVQ